MIAIFQLEQRASMYGSASQGHRSVNNSHRRSPKKSGRNSDNRSRGGRGRSSRGGRGRSGRGGGRSRGSNSSSSSSARYNNYVSPERWRNMSYEERGALMRSRQGRNSNAGTTPSQVNVANTQDNGSQVSEVTESPTFRSIMRSNVSNSGSSRQANALGTRRLHVQHTDEPANFALIDGGADTCLLGDVFHVLSTTDRRVDIVGYDNQVTSQSVPIGTGVALARTSDGTTVLLRVNEGLILGGTKSLLSSNQIRAFGHRVDDVPTKYLGSQRLETADGHVFDFSYVRASVQLTLTKPTKADLKQYDVVELTADSPWDPCSESDDRVDSDPRDVLPSVVPNVDDFIDDDLPASAVDYVDYADINAARTRKTEPQWQRVRACLGWKPLSVVKRTFDATTQLAQNFVRLPLRQHFKSRFPALNVRRLREVFATDTFFASKPALGGATCVQLYCGKTSHFTDVFEMKTDGQMPDTLEDFIRKWGAPEGLFSDNAKAETSHRVKDILRQYNIADFQSEPYYEHQNLAERRIQDVKSMCNTIMDRTGTPEHLWLLCLVYCVMLLNHLATSTLDWRTPIEKCFGVTPDISPFLCFEWYEPVLYHDRDASFPNSKEKFGRFVGVAEHVGDALTFKILTDDTQQIIHRSVVRSARDAANPNLRSTLSPSGGEVPARPPSLTPPAVGPTDAREDDPGESAPRPVLTSEVDAIDPDNLRLPVVDPLDLLGTSFVKADTDSGEQYKTTVLRQVDDDEDNEPMQAKFVVGIGDGDREEIMTYNAILEHLNKHVEATQDQDDGFARHIYKAIVGHKKVKGKWMLKILWDDESVDWRGLDVMGSDDPVTVARYAYDHDLLEEPGWKRFKKYAKNKQKYIRMLKQARLRAARTAPLYKFGVQVPRNVPHALELDRINGNNHWQEAIDTELAQVIEEYETFKDMGVGYKPPPDYKKIRTHFVFDVKFDLRRKARLVADGNLTGAPKDSTYSGVVSIRSIRMCLLLAELNQLEIMAADVGNAYLEAKTQEKLYIIAGPEFGKLSGHTLIFVRALYGLKSSGLRWHERMADVLFEMGYKPSKGDPDVWMRDCGDHYDYICVYVDDLLILSKKPNDVIAALRKKYKFKLKGVGFPKYYLGADIERRTHPESVLIMGSKTYIGKILGLYEKMFGSPPPANIHTPLDPADHPELDDSKECDAAGVKQYQSLMGMLQWAVTLGRIDIHCSVMTMSRFRTCPRIGHLDRVKRIFAYLRNYKKTAIKFRTEIPDYSRYKIEPQKWEYVYGDVYEELPPDMPEPKGNPVRTSHFADAKLLHDLVTGKSVTGILHMINKTPIDWYSKRQATVESATYGSEFVAARVCVDQIIDLRYTLRMLGVPLDGPAWMFGDNLSVVVSSTIPSSSLKKRHNALAYHRVREAVAAKIVHFLHIPGKENPADVLTRALSSRNWFPLLKPILYWGMGEDKEMVKLDPSYQGEGSMKKPP